MANISIEQFVELVKLKANLIIDGPRGQWVFQNLYQIQFTDGHEHFEFDRVQVLQYKNPINIPDDEITTCESYDHLIVFLKSEGYIKDGYLKANQTYPQLKADIAFEHINMKDLLIKYSECETFSLTMPYNEGHDALHPYGKYSITQEQADIALLQVIADKANLYSYYKSMPNAFRAQHYFESLVNEIQQESLAWYEKDINQQLKPDESPFASDLFIEGKTKFKAPKALWHFYHAQDRAQAYRVALSNMLINTESRPITFALEEPYYEPLKSSYLYSTIGFSWHCTTSSVLSITHRFKLDEQAKIWLSRLKNDYDMATLEDLAFYYRGHLAFSSCTHEQVHYDYLEQAKKDAHDEA